MSYTERLNQVLAIQLLKQSRLHQAFADLAQSPEIQDFLDL